MKKYCLLFSAAILSVFALSCSKADNSNDGVLQNEGEQSVIEDKGEIPEGYVRLSFAAEAEETKTTIADGEGSSKIVSWAVGDKVKVSYAGGSTETQAEEAGATSTFTVDVPEGTGQLYFSYPSTAAASLSDGTLSLTIPAVQDGAFEKANYLLATAATSDSGMRFYNAGSLFKIVVDDATLTKAEITGNDGEALCGTVPYTFSESGITPGTATETGTKITVNFNGAGTYYVSALPGLSLTDGATLRFFRGDVPAGGAKWSGDQTVARASIKSWGNSDKITNRYVRSDAAAGGNGRSWENAWGKDELVAFLTNSAGRTNAQLDLMNGITVKVAAGTYNTSGTSVDFSAYTDGTLTVSFLGGYPAAGGADSARDASTNETIFSGNDEGCVLWAYNVCNLNFDGFTFSHGSTSAGGKAAVVFSNSGSASLSNCIFKDNVNTATAGALTFNGGTFSATNCTFTNNTAAHAGAVNVDNANTNATISSCTFTGNHCGNGNGGALKVTQGTVTIDQCVFTGNYTENHGGALWMASGTTEVTNCTFHSNYSHWGGAVYTHKGNAVPTVRFTSCIFGGTADEKNYTDPNSGGAISCDAGNLYIKQCSFTGNTAEYDRGGAIFATGTDSKIYIGEDGTTASGGSFTSNSGKYGGVMSIQNGALVFIYNAEFASNKASNHGGVICLFQGSPSVHLKDNNIHDNEATGLAGGVIAAFGSGTANINEPKIYIEGGITFKDNYAPSGGGAIRLRNEPVAATEGDTQGNETKASLYISGQNSFIGNHTKNGYGGCLDLRTSGTVTVEGATFTGNYTNEDHNAAKGGAVNLSDASLGTGDFTFTNCVFDGNYTNGASNSAVGGAVNVGGNNTNWAMKAKFDKCLFKDNHSRQGGAIFCQDASAVTWLNACVFTGNYIRKTYGTTIAATTTGTLCMNNCSFADDTYTVDGTTAQQATWINAKTVSKLVICNSTMIGINRRYNNGSLSETNPNLLRYDGKTVTSSSLINNIIAPTVNTTNAIDAQSNTITAIGNKRGTVLNNSGYSGSGTESDGYLGTSAYFGGLSWASSGTASWDNRYWGWNGTLSGGNDTTKAALTDIQTAIQTADADFYNWLNSIGALDKDCRGKTRGATTWPGAYDGTNN